MASKPRRHHFNPQALTRFFAGEGGQVLYYERGTPSLGVQDRNTRSVFWLPHLYSSWHPDGSRDTSLEEEYGREIDDKLGPLVKGRLRLLESGRFEGLSIEARTFFVRLLINFFIRNPSIHEMMQEEPQSALGLRLMRAGLHIRDGNEARAWDLLSGRDDLSKKERIEALVFFARSDLSGLEERFLRMGVHFLIPTDSEGEFVTASFPFVRVHPDGRDLQEQPFGPDVEPYEYIMPLTPRLALVLSGSVDASGWIGVGRDQIDRINSALFRSTHSIVARSRRTIERLIALNEQA